MENNTNNIGENLEEIRQLLNIEAPERGSDTTITNEEPIVISEEDFVEWLKTADKNDGTVLAEGMQIQYHYLLKSIPSMFGLKNVFTVITLSEFEKYDSELRELAAFKEAYPHVGAGALSSALRKYQKYLEERTNGLKSNNELAAILKQWYESKPVQANSTSSLVGFGLKYGYSIKKNKITSKKLLELSGIDSTLGAYIDRGVDLYAAFVEGSIGIRFLDSYSENLQIGRNYSYRLASCGGENLVVYGTPGCGKSFYVDHEILGKDDSGKYIGDYSERTVIRTTFYQDYSNTDFVGQIVPVIEYEKDATSVDKSVVTYRFVPGPFTIALECALENPTKKVALVIEELNRGNAPCIFGDLFQLLDRIDEEEKEYPVGTSEYGIINTNLLNYLKDNDPNHYTKEYKYCFDLDEIRIPANLSIYATMNTSDQNVFTLDTAFKRRWDFFKLQNKFDNHTYKDYIVPGMQMTWEKFVESINKHIADLSNESGLLTTEDKQIGVYFVSKKMLIEPGQEEKETLKKKFAYKVLEYLWDDVAKYSRDRWFVKATTLDDLIEDYCSGKQVFKDGIFTNSDSSEA